MKNLTAFIAVAAAMVAGLFSVAAHADAVYPVTNAYYTPSAISPVQNFTAPGTYAVTLQNRSVIGVEVNGTCTSLAATIQTTVDGTTWRAVNVYPVVTGTVTAAASISAAGAYRAMVAGAKAARVNITALTATCNVSAIATEGGMSLNQ